jgi:hypothetical protein
MPGTHRVEARRPGRPPVAQIVQVGPGETASVSLVLGEGSSSRGAWYRNNWGWVALGTGVAVAGAGTAMVLMAEGRKDDVRKALDDPSSTDRSQRALRDDWDSAGTLSTAGWIAAGVGGAAITTSLVLFATGGDDDDAPAAFVPVLTPDACALGVAGGF